MLFVNFNDQYRYFKLVIPLLNLYLLFYKQSFKIFLQISSLFCFLYFLLGGFNLVLQLYLNNLLLSVFIICIIILLFFEFFFIPSRKQIKIKEFYYNAEINGLSVKAFLDSGNMSYDLIYNLPIVFINTKYRFQCKSVGHMKIKTLNNIGYIEIFETNNFKIENKLKDCVIAFMDMEFDCIIGLDLIYGKGK